MREKEERPVGEERVRMEDEMAAEWGRELRGCVVGAHMRPSSIATTQPTNNRFLFFFFSGARGGRERVAHLFDGERVNNQGEAVVAANPARDAGDVTGMHVRVADSDCRGIHFLTLPLVAKRAIGCGAVLLNDAPSKVFCCLSAGRRRRKYDKASAVTMTQRRF